MWVRHGGASRPSFHALRASHVPTNTKTHVAAWNSPSASVFASSPAIVSAGYLSGVGQQVMPLEDLVEHDPVDEPAEPDPQHQCRHHGHSTHTRRGRRRIRVAERPAGTCTADVPGSPRR